MPLLVKCRYWWWNVAYVCDGWNDGVTMMVLQSMYIACGAFDQSEKDEKFCEKGHGIGALSQLKECCIACHLYLEYHTIDLFTYDPRLSLSLTRERYVQIRLEARRHLQSE